MKTVRCAIYTRQSLDEGDQEFKSVDAQRDSIRAYITSQRAMGWVALQPSYDDAGFTGADTNRPGFKRLMADVEAGRVDTIVVHKFDRLSRSLSDFALLTARLEKSGVAMCSVMEGFDTSTSTGRMMVNVVMSFAQFERESIAERTKTKMTAMRARGMWAGGNVPLGYDVVAKRLVVNPDEAERVRAIFRLYLEKGSLLTTVEELNARGWRTKSWTGKKGQQVASYVWSIESLRQLLSRVVYRGLIKAGKKTYPGVHEAIVDEALWDAVQQRKRRMTSSPRIAGRNKYGALLKAILFCGECGSTMNHSVSGAEGRRYQYYDCNASRRFGRNTCPSRPVPVAQIDEFVVEKVRAIGRDPALVRETVKAARAELESRTTELSAEVRRQELDARRVREERTNLVNAVAAGGPGVGTLMIRVAELDDRLGQIEARVRQVQQELAAASTGAVDVEGLTRALAEFDGLWEALFVAERARVLALLIERVTFASDSSVLKITFRTNGLAGLGAA